MSIFNTLRNLPATISQTLRNVADYYVEHPVLVPTFATLSIMTLSTLSSPITLTPLVVISGAITAAITYACAVEVTEKGLEKATQDTLEEIQYVAETLYNKIPSKEDIEEEKRQLKKIGQDLIEVTTDLTTTIHKSCVAIHGYMTSTPAIYTPSYRNTQQGATVQQPAVPAQIRNTLS